MYMVGGRMRVRELSYSIWSEERREKKCYVSISMSYLLTNKSSIYYVYIFTFYLRLLEDYSFSQFF